jgi:hypothetical protein
MRMTQSHAVPNLQQSRGDAPSSDVARSLLGEDVVHQPLTLDLVDKLCRALAAEDVTYCHWKSNNALDRSASGDNDLDLLVSRADIARFAGILCRLGFKAASAPVEKQLPGVQDYFGYDPRADKWIHVHAHYQLVLGHDTTKNVRLPIEKPYLESAVQGDLFRVPAPEFELIVFVIRMMLKHATWDAVLSREGRLKAVERRELAYLKAQIDPGRVEELLRQYLPYISVGLFRNCVRALEPGCPAWTRVSTGHRLLAGFRADARRSGIVDLGQRLERRAVSVLRRRILGSSPKYRLQAGGAMVALVGGDGAGKSTAIDALYGWLAEHFETTTAHLGRPTWSLTTRCVRGILKIGNLLRLYPVDASLRETIGQQSLVSPGYPWLLREVCRARDRYRTYLNARRYAAKGGLVLLDRFPLPQIQLMDGPLAARFVSQLAASPQAKGWMRPHPNSQLAKALVKLDERYHAQFAFPELLVVLLVNPSLAVERKTDEDALSVRERSTEIWNLNWEDSGAYVVDGSRSKADVLAELKVLLWSRL